MVFVLYALCAALALAAALLLALLVGQAWVAQSKTEAEAMALSGYRVHVKDNAAASGAKKISFSTNGSASSSFDGAATDVTLRARGQACQGTPQLKVYVDGDLRGTVDLTSSAFADHTLALGGLSTGTHTLRVSFENDHHVPLTCERNA